MIKIEMPETPVVYPTKFAVGDYAICKKTVWFMEGEHIKGEEILVSEKTQAYFNVNHDLYDKKVFSF